MIGQDEKYGIKKQIGLIAQDLEKIYPEVVITDNKSGLKSVSYDHLIAPLIEAFKSFYGDFKSVVARVINYEAENAQIKIKIAKLETENIAIKQALCELGKKSFCSK